MASLIYNSAKKKLMDGSIDLDSDTIKAALVTSSYTPDIDAHDFFDDITNEVSGTGYTAGGITLTNKSITVDNTNDRAVFDADDISWAASTITARRVIIYKSTGTASTSPVIAVVDLGTDQSSSASTLKIQWDSAGLFYLS